MVFNSLPSAHRYSKPCGNPSPGGQLGIPSSQTIPHIRDTSLKKSTADSKEWYKVETVELNYQSHGVLVQVNGRC